MIMLWEVLYHQADARLAFIVLKEQLPLYPVQLVNITQAFKRIAVSHVLKEGSVMKKDLVIQLLELKHANPVIIVSQELLFPAQQTIKLEECVEQVTTVLAVALNFNV